MRYRARLSFGVISLSGTCICNGGLSFFKRLLSIDGYKSGIRCETCSL
jgi:hypothetical protein